MSKFRVVLAALAIVVALGAGVAAAASAAGPSHQHAAATSHGAAGTTSPKANSDSAHGTRPQNHGFFVSQAAHTCGHGAHAVHGKCVRAVAHSSKGK